MPVSSQATAHRWRTIGRAAAPRPRRSGEAVGQVIARAAVELHSRTVPSGRGRRRRSREKRM